MLCCKFIANKVTFKLKEGLTINDTLYYYIRIDNTAKNRKLHKFATTNKNFEKINYSRQASSYINDNDNENSLF